MSGHVLLPGELATGSSSSESKPSRSSRTTRDGFPMTRLRSGTSRLTTDPAAAVECMTIVICGKMTAPAPTVAPAPIASARLRLAAEYGEDGFGGAMAVRPGSIEYLIVAPARSQPPRFQQDKENEWRGLVFGGQADLAKR